ncbi:MAG TPA: GNAT family protein [Victivallales bacterium]|nr:GNAT family protein [Victivallales bacterium]
MIPILKIDNLLLREIKESDKLERKKSGYDPYVMKMFGHINDDSILSDKEIDEWYSFMLKTDYAWIVELKNKVVGQVRLNRIDNRDKNAAFSIGFFSSKSCGKGLGVKVTKLVLKFAFEQLKLHKVYLRVLEYNKGGIKCYQNCGFKTDGILRENGLINEKWENDILMSILADEFKN